MVYVMKILEGPLFNYPGSESGVLKMQTLGMLFVAKLHVTEDTDLYQWDIHLDST